MRQMNTRQPNLVLAINSIALAILCFGGTPTFAFKPYVHSELTKMALAPSFVSFTKPDGNSVVFDKLEVVPGIAGENMAEDYSLNFFFASVHFDNELFEESSDRLLQYRKLVRERAIEGADGNYSSLLESRKLLGAALHTLQDFYAHSTWVERNGTQLAPLGISAVAVGGNAPCPSGDGTTLAVPKILSSGYFDVVSSVVPKVEQGKCAHGVFPPQYRNRGINKDESGRPLYVEAAVAAARASSKYVNEIIGDIIAARRPEAVCALMGYPVEKWEECAFNSPGTTLFAFVGTVQGCEYVGRTEACNSSPLLGQRAVIQVSATRGAKGVATGDGVRFDSAIRGARIAVGSRHIALSCPSCSLIQWHYRDTNDLAMLDIDVPPDVPQDFIRLEVVHQVDGISEQEDLIDREDLPVVECLPIINQSRQGLIDILFVDDDIRYRVEPVTDYAPRCEK